MRRRLVGVLGLVVAAVLLTGCNWFPSVRFDAGNSGFNAADHTLTAARVNAMTKRFTASLGDLGPHAPGMLVTPVYASGHVIVPRAGGLAFYDAAGVDGCSGIPTVCQPQWVGDFGAPWYSYLGAEVAGDVVYVEAGDIHDFGKLYAFDLNGTQGCSGTPTVCQPLWTADVLNDDAPTVVGGKVYTFDMHDQLRVYDAAGQTNCSGAPRVCEPLWTVPSSRVEAPPRKLAVVDGSVFFVDYEGRLTVSDANGVKGCSGTPKVCEPLWTSPPTTAMNVPSPIVSGGRVFIERRTLSGFEVAAFDAAGATNCIGTSNECEAVWSTPLPGSQSGSLTMPAIANGRVYVPVSSTGTIVVLDAAGTGCAGVPVTCPTLFTIGNGNAGPVVVVDNGLVLESGGNQLRAYDAAGVTNCTGGVCSPVAHVNLAGSFGGFSTGDGKVFGVTIAADNTATLTAVW